MDIVGIKYHGKFAVNGVSEFVCNNCGRREGRFCGKELIGDEIEPIGCDGKAHPHVVDL